MRVLVIDDERPLADTLTLILRAAGYEVMAAYDGAEALSNFASFLPDLVLSDVVMPGMNGLEVCERIQTALPACRIVLFSGQAETNELMQSARAKGQDWELLAKPVNPRELLARLAELRIHSSGAENLPT